MDRNALFDTWKEMHKSQREGKIDYADIVSIINRVTQTDTFVDYISMDHPYSIGDIRKQEIYNGIFPQKMSVEAQTRLSLKEPTASGYINFKKKEYGNMIEDEFDKLT